MPALRSSSSSRSIKRSPRNPDIHFPAVVFPAPLMPMRKMDLLVRNLVDSWVLFVLGESLPCNATLNDCDSVSHQPGQVFPTHSRSRIRTGVGAARDRTEKLMATLWSS